MKIYNTKRGIVIEHLNEYFLSPESDWDVFVNRSGLFRKVLEEIHTLDPEPSLSGQPRRDILAPISKQEVWASGVTYLRSREARMEESKDAGGGDFYARVYEAKRPELFFKAAPHRVIGTGGTVRIRKDSKWNVPEPELVLFICSSGSIEGYTIGNDMSSRDIEGENPLYLPQAKCYDGSAAIGPCLYVPEQAIDPKAMIRISIDRSHESVFYGEISIDRMKRTQTELAEYLFQELSFPHGAFLMTGTGIVPPDTFTLREGDVIKITIEHIGTLENTVA
ncbi:fumarylacetoacetate hydrolase family protein [Pseudochryseolinea flava]|uniref:2-hydroxyhepta-2,4-diene-1,7-dioate isomerase n=1 Tax=Pseudochryseolinea flava TaxID=2059302 RepID=A0A364XXC8_9BACT|nr:fumarylacetoacetate hydrolase family protein [Pseudochryseolinea flava]RAV98915.1 2-hydroxyhepta-2,4-diene-1,7-dioate isomerase [Pseudochryseolinea flava]